MSTVSALNRRHALGLPAGSVRAVHVLAIVALVCAIVLIPTEKPVPVAPYLTYLLFLMVGHFFAAHGVSIATRSDPEPSPLHLPGGVVRVIVVVALVGSIGWKLYYDENGLYAQFQATLEALKREPFLPVVIMGAFFLGVGVRAIVGRQNPPQWWQDFEAWLSVLALVFLVVCALIELVINPSLDDKLHLPAWEGFVGAIIAFYFGERS